MDNLIKDDFIKKLADPPAEYRPVPFWSWNDRLDSDYLRWQIGEMKQAGIGGFFMHARSGLETEYLGKDWMKCVTDCADEGKKLQMSPWLYDEDGWPSGFAGGRVTALGDAYHGRWLVMERVAAGVEPQGNDILGVYTQDSETGSVTPVKPDDAKAERIVIRHRSNPYYIDVMSHQAVKAFLHFTHELYDNVLDGRLGDSVKGFFTDEPRLSGDIEGDIPWSYALPEQFLNDHGYDLLPVLPALFMSTPGCEKIRYDFWNTVSSLFVSSYIRQISDWCHAHNCRLTGHIMMEESIFTQMTGTGGVMPFYEYMDIPGIDWLRRQISNPVVPKQVGSVACQLDKKSVLTESFALCGWNVSFEELKWIAEWEFVNGVNLMCQHLEGYTLRGQRKRDYPPSLFIQQSWWSEYNRFNTYLARLGVALTTGKPGANVLLIHPLRSGWILYNGRANDEINRLDAEFIRVSEALSGMHVDYHYGDETILSRHARIDGRRLMVGSCGYDTVVLPTMSVISSTTVKLLLAFAEKGGQIVCAGDFPALCDGKPDDILDKLRSCTQMVGCDETKLRAAMSACAPLRIQANGADAKEIHYQQRNAEGVRLFFMVNHSNETIFETEIAIKDGGYPCLIDLNTAVPAAVLYTIESDTRLSLRFLPMQSYLLAVYDTPDALPAPAPAVEEKLIVKPASAWTVEAMDDNAMTLDTCRCRIDGGEWSEPKPVIHLMDELLALKRSCDIELKFTFTAQLELINLHRMYMALESADAFEIAVNGKPVTYTDIGWWKDSSFQKVDIRPFIKNGENEITLKRRFYQSQKVYDVLFGNHVYETELNKLTYDVELESIYLVGDFGAVSETLFTSGARSALVTPGPFTLVDQPQTLSNGDFTTQGLLFFAGSITLTQPLMLSGTAGKRVILSLNHPDAPMLTVRINGQDVGALLWAPYELDITKFVHNGENRLELQFFASNRNLLGPHHHVSGELYSVGPQSFTGRWSWVEKESEAIPSTEAQRAAGYWSDSYCFVRFGLDS